MILNTPPKKHTYRVFTFDGTDNKTAQQRLTVAAVRAGAYVVSSRANHVTIDQDKIAVYARQMVDKYKLTTAMSAENHLVLDKDPRLTATYVLALDSINFGSGYFEIAKRAFVELEYNHIAKSLKNAFMGGLWRDPARWMDATAADFHTILSVRPRAHPELDSLMELFAYHLSESGKRIVAEYRGDVMNLIEASNGSAAKLADIVSSWPTFYDTAFYRGVEVPFFKRAQILAADMVLSLKTLNFSDMDQLTIFADNMVPHVLHCDGILSYSPDLQKQIDQGEFIDSGSAQEIELRAAAIHAVELMKQSLQEQGRSFTSVNLDHILWHRGYEPAIYAKRSHKTLSVWY